MKLTIVPTHLIDRAWKDGANCLAETCKLVDEITGSQLKLMLARGERMLVALMDGENKVGWGTCKVEQLPNMRVLFVYDLYAKGADFKAFWPELKRMAELAGCSRIRLAAPDEARARLYRQKLGFKPVYTTMEMEI